MARRFTVGRDPYCDVSLGDESVSRYHAEIWLAGDGALMIADMRSSSGTRLIRDGRAHALEQDTVMQSDSVQFGKMTITVKELIVLVERKCPGGLTLQSTAPNATQTAASA